MCGSFLQFEFATEGITEITQEIIFYRSDSTSSTENEKNTFLISGVVVVA